MRNKVYEIGIDFIITGDANSQLKALLSAITPLNEELTSLTNKLALAKSGITSLDANLKTLQSGIVATDAKLEQLSSGLKGVGTNLKTSGGLAVAMGGSLGALAQGGKTAFDSMTRHAGMLNTEIKSVSGHLTALTGQLKNTASIEKSTLAEAASGAGIGGGGDHRGGGGRGGHYIGHHFGRHTGGLLGGIAGGALGGGVGLAGMAAAYVGYKAFETGSELQIQKMRGQMQGISPADIKKANAYIENTTIAGASKLENAIAYQQALVVTKGNPDEALKLAPFIEKQYLMNKILATGMGKNFTEFDESNLSRAAEIKSGSNLAAPQMAASNQIEKSYVMEGFNLTPYNIMGFMRRAPAAIKGLSPAGFYALMPIAQEEGGPTLGMQLRTLNSAMLRGQNFKTGAKGLGLLHKMGVYTKKGFIGESLFHTDTAAWINTVLEPQIRRYLVKEHMAPTQANVRKMETTSLPGVLPNLASLIAQNIVKEENARLQAPKAWGVNKGFGKAMTTQSGSVMQLTAAATNFLIALSDFASPVLIAALKTLTFSLNILTDAFKLVARFAKMAATILPAGVTQIFKTAEHKVASVAGALSIPTGNYTGSASGRRGEAALTALYQNPFGLMPLGTAANKPYLSHGNAQPVYINIPLHLDSTQVGEAAVSYLGTVLNQPSSTSNIFDPQWSLGRSAINPRGTMNG